MERAKFVPPQRSNPEWFAELKECRSVALGTAIHTSSSLVAEMASSIGYDFCLIDAQHSAVDTEQMRELLQAVHCGGAKAFVRVAGCYDRIGIQQAFDLGADGILVPRAQTAEDVEHAVSCAKYPVRGQGSEGGTRSVFVNLRPQLPGGFPGLFDYVGKRANSETILAFQIETASALNRVEDICAVPGVDIAFIGPGDLATDMGLVAEHGMPACWATDDFSAAEKRVAAACHANGVIAGYWSSDIKAKGPLGFRFFVVNGDMVAMQDSLRESLSEKARELDVLGFGSRIAGKEAKSEARITGVEAKPEARITGVEAEPEACITSVEAEPEACITGEVEAEPEARITGAGAEPEVCITDAELRSISASSYVDRFDVTAACKLAVAAALKRRPEDPKQFIAELLIKAATVRPENPSAFIADLEGIPFPQDRPTNRRESPRRQRREIRSRRAPNPALYRARSTNKQLTA